MNQLVSAVANRLRYWSLVRNEATGPTVSLADAVARARVKRPTRIGVDVFDTVLMRRVVGDRAAEAVVAQAQKQAGTWERSANDWCQARADAWKSDPDGALTEWLTSPSFEGVVSASKAFDVELRAERELLLPVPGARQALADLRAIAPVMFVSDMYLSAEHLAEILAANELLDPSDEVIVSCDARASKSGGDLFGVAFPDVDLEAGDVLFIGNNPWSDGAMAAAAGARPVHVSAANPTRYEDALVGRPGSVGPIVAAAARLERLELDVVKPSGHDVRRVGAAVLGPLMIGFVLWARDRCRQLDVSKLEFLSRDGELPLRVAETLPADFWSGMSLDYLQCSRRAWSLAAAPLVGVDEWVRVGTSDEHAFLLHSSSSAPFRSLLGRCRLDQDDLPASSILRSVDANAPLDEEQGRVWADLLRSGSLDASIAKAAIEPSRDLIDFLRQRGLPNTRVALIDVGWRGQQAWLMSALVREITGHEPVHLHFGGDQVVAAVDRATHIERFALDDSREEHPIDSPVSCLEMFLATGGPRLLGYEREGQRVVERFDEGEPEIDSQTRRWLVEGALGAAAHMPSVAECERWMGATLEGEVTSLRDEVRSVLADFWNKPSLDETHALRALRYEVDDVGHVVGSVIRPYGLDDFVGHTEIPRQWRQASLVMTREPLRSLVRAAHIVRAR